MNMLLRSEPALYEVDFSIEGFSWVDYRDWENSIIVFLRKNTSAGRRVLVACNLTPIVRYGYRVGVPVSGYWREALNSDSDAYGGANVGNSGGLDTEPVPSHGHMQSLSLTLPPLGVVFLVAP